jgi:hypothetical protein
MPPRVERPRMSAYGVPSEVTDALAWSWAEERLQRCRNYWVVTVSPDGRPHGMPVWGVWLSQQERFWFSCAPDSFKARNLASNPHMVVMVDDTVEVVSLEGTAAAVAADPLCAQQWAQKYEPDPAKHAEMIQFLAGNAAFEVTPRKAFGVIEREDEFATKATRWVW